MGRFRTIALKCSRCNQGEATLDTAAKPGMNICIAADGKYDPGAGVASAEQIQIVNEDNLVHAGGGTVDGTYAIADKASYLIPNIGDEVALLVLDAEVCTIGALFKPNAAGKFVKTATAPAQFMCLETITVSGDQLVQMRRVR